jgi:maltose O-acetyltransferase
MYDGILDGDRRMARAWGKSDAWREPMLSERDKMLAGQLYDPLDPQLVRARERARELCQALNATREADQEARRRILKELFGAGGNSVWMQPPFFCDYGSNIRLGERVFFNFNCVVLDVCPVTVGDFTLFGRAVQVNTATHPMNGGLRRRQEYGRPIDIGSDVWVGGGAILCPGVKVGSRSVIGAGSVVTRDIPDGVFAAGNPCRVVREITEEGVGPQGPLAVVRPGEDLYGMGCPKQGWRFRWERAACSPWPLLWPVWEGRPGQGRPARKPPCTPSWCPTRSSRVGSRLDS